MTLLLLCLPAALPAMDVVDLSGPDGVSLAFGRLSEGTTAWKASLDGNRDAWGNLVGPGYVGAERPDHPSTAQLDFLADWYGRHPERGLRIARTSVEASCLRASIEAERRLAAAAEAARRLEDRRRLEGPLPPRTAARRSRLRLRRSIPPPRPVGSPTRTAPEPLTPRRAGTGAPTRRKTLPDLAGAARAESPAPSASGEHRASFLFDDARTRAMNVLSPRCPDGDFEKILGRMKANGDTVAYLFLANEGDGGWAGYSPYGGTELGKAVDEAAVRHMKARLARVRDAGLSPILWLRADDSPATERAEHGAAGTLPERCRAPLRRGLRRLGGGGSSSTRASPPTRCGASRAHLKGLTRKKVGVHFTSLERADMALASGADLFYGQYGFGKSARRDRGRHPPPW